MREDGRAASFPLDRIGRVYAPIYQLNEDAIERAFAEVRAKGPELVIPEPRLRDVDTEEADALAVIDGLIESTLSNVGKEDRRKKCKEVVWAALEDDEAVHRSRQRRQSLEEEVWEPFERRARVLAAFGYLDFEAERVTERGRWLADLHVDRPLIVGEALECGLFKSLDITRMAGVVAALTADEDRDYGELELDDALVGSLTLFEDVGFRVSSEEWRYHIDPAPELNFSAAATAAHWAAGKEWATLVAETRAEEGDLFRMLSRTGEALLQIASLRRAHADAARIASAAAEAVLRDPVR
jgi:superfamily II RNA helicase